MDRIAAKRTFAGTRREDSLSAWARFAQQAVTTACNDSAMTTSWRANVSSEVQDDLDELFGAALGLAEHLLGKNGEFFPFAVTLPTSGGQADLAEVLDDSLGEQPNSVDVLESLYSTIGTGGAELIGAAFVADVGLTSGGSAVRIQAEHAQGPALEIKRVRVASSMVARSGVQLPGT